MSRPTDPSRAGTNLRTQLGRMTLLVLSVALAVSSQAYSQSQGSPATSCTPLKTSTREEAIMFGRIVGGIEDLGGGYYKEAQGRYASIVRDIEKKDYNPCLRWMAYDGYGETLVALKKKDKAIASLTRAVQIANTLSDKERGESTQHLEAAQ